LTVVVVGEARPGVGTGWDVTKRFGLGKAIE
jgi:hypothetical protein